MNAPAGAFRCQSLAKEIAAELRAKVRSESSMLAGQRVLITKFDHDPSRAVGSARHKRCSWPIGACVPPSHRSASCNAGASPTIQRSRRDRDNEAILSRAVHPEWRTGGAVGRKIAAASRRLRSALRRSQNASPAGQPVTAMCLYVPSSLLLRDWSLPLALCYSPATWPASG